ncbi:PEP-CTERM sorting domain-containing protein [Pelomonas sp. UHG3]|uniref:PEP-CTERM sorting domain-containing protein n=1 Tax=Roseateles hydrophilus TaxID=2975054 RepID=A0ACC6CBL2_9BURK|nr:PEP-CTERM sorting domain-containing protein [Pelomonas sp. UHG3]MCY4745836.1 PEP-CTERM sorting domain-containing protein [Pelomonas sp. UHG3]
MASTSLGLLRSVAAVLATVSLGISAAPLHMSLSFGDRSGPDANTLSSTSLAAILRGDAEGLFSSANLQHASFSGVGILGAGNVTSVSAIRSGTDSYCVDKCRTISGHLFQGGVRSGSYALDWYFNDALAPVGEFPPGSGQAPLKDVVAHPAFPGSGDYPGYLAAYTPYSAYASLYGARLTLFDLLGNDVFISLFQSHDCTETGSSCSAFEVVNDFEKQFSNPVDGLFMHFVGPVGQLPEPGTLALLGVAMLGLRRRQRQAPSPGC